MRKYVIVFWKLYSANEYEIAFPNYKFASQI